MKPSVRADPNKWPGPGTSKHHRCGTVTVCGDSGTPYSVEFGTPEHPQFIRVFTHADRGLIALRAHDRASRDR